MRSVLRIVVVGGALALASLVGCGQDRAERGAVGGPEVDTPEAKREMRETEAQREAETDRGVDQQEQKALDEAAKEERKQGGGQP
jgi:hypothetical protein